MAAFHPVNSSLGPEAYKVKTDDIPATTPRPSTAPNALPPRLDDATTPTRANFGALAGQMPLPNPATAQHLSDASAAPTKAEVTTAHRGDSQFSTKSADSGDVDMDDEGDEGHEGREGSEESTNPDGSRSSKKKKSQRFYCTDFPPCSLSFTRSEHLARHIRKHTGERPFECHCSRKFSRLDNLRQHAQTVHLNEEIPHDSPAATGTRFQRTVRPERVRPPGNRARASSNVNRTGPVRGHTRNSLSASSITSMSSVGTVYSQDTRRRPQALVMADSRNRLSQEMYLPESPISSTPYQGYGDPNYRPASPGGYGTPTSSAAFSTGPNSPRYSTMQSPISSHSRTASVYNDHQTSQRRLSVPSAGNPFQSPHNYGQPSFPGPSGPPSLSGYSPSSSIMTSPTTPNAPSWQRRESVSSTREEDSWRRRTWHPDTYSEFTSRLRYATNPNQYSNDKMLPKPPTVPSNAPAIQGTQLPGIESFFNRRPLTPIQRQPSPMMLDTPSKPPPLQPAYQYSEEYRTQPWDRAPFSRDGPSAATPTSASLDKPGSAGSWASETTQALQARADSVRNQPTVRFEESSYVPRPSQGRSYHQHTLSAPNISHRDFAAPWSQIVPNSVGISHARPGMYDGPVQRTSPADSSSSEGAIPGTPSSATVGEYMPSIVHSSGWVESRHGASAMSSSQNNSRPTSSHFTFPATGTRYSNDPHHPIGTPAEQHSNMHSHGHVQQPPKAPDNNMLRLEALVAVATSEEAGAAAAF